MVVWVPQLTIITTYTTCNTSTSDTSIVSKGRLPSSSPLPSDIQAWCISACYQDFVSTNQGIPHSSKDNLFCKVLWVSFLPATLLVRGLPLPLKAFQPHTHSVSSWKWISCHAVSISMSIVPHPWNLRVHVTLNKKFQGAREAIKIHHTATSGTGSYLFCRILGLGPSYWGSSVPRLVYCNLLICSFWANSQHHQLRKLQSTSFWVTLRMAKGSWVRSQCANECRILGTTESSHLIQIDWRKVLSSQTITRLSI